VEVLTKSNIHIVARPLNSSEPDLLIGNEHQVLNIFDLGEQFLMNFEPPTTGWTHDLLENIEIPTKLHELGCEFKLGTFWIGSTEL